MQSKNLVHKLQKKYPDITFVSDDICKWSSSTRTVHYDLTEEYFEAMLLHELAHALLEHEDFALDIELVRMEAEAWEKAEDIAKSYGVKLPTEQVDQSLESYRYWLHQRSRCPECSQNGLQTKNTHYKCFACGCVWRANDARVCGLKRYKVTV